MNHEPRRPAARGDTAPAAPATPRALSDDELTGLVMKGLFIVQRELGTGFLESVYERAAEIVLAEMGLRVERQLPLDVRFRGRVIGTFVPDLLVEQRVLVELKAVREIAPAHVAQVLNYLKVSGIRIGFLANYTHRLQLRRFAL